MRSTLLGGRPRLVLRLYTESHVNLADFIAYPGFRITPNAVVSFIATLAKSSFLLVTTETIGQLKWLHYHRTSHQLSDIKTFDEASRGPLGSAQLLIKHKSRLLASTAAIIVLAALFVDPFVQLVLSFPSRRTLASTQDSSFQIATIYDPNRSILNQAVSPGGFDA